MKTVSCLITSSPEHALRMQEALFTLRTFLSAGHAINNVFFYQAGCANANGYLHVPSDEFNANTAWREFSLEFNIPLLVCVSSAEKRGVIDTALSHEYEANGYNLHQPFEQVGIGEFFTRLHDADKLVQF
ncbi:sulfurtransferase complex subunit TusD [Alteromonas facilis]|uniref:sulfurtransferase complex subunit TusD n=1 Tax=Alteromonas facilis TaxID=2048004 RepID=UPI0013DA89A2|nr:sulfurtransferase complex subunit TusD [Alteromonas facilis]